jgi:cytochrome c556
MWKSLFLSIGLAVIASSQTAGVDVIAARQASLDMSSITFRSMGDAIKAGREAKSQAYPASVLAKWAKVLPGMFPPGSGEGATQARPAVWRDRPGFEKAAANYADATAKLAALASANDTAGFTTQLDAVNLACAACHSRYKNGDQGPPKK